MNSQILAQIVERVVEEALYDIRVIDDFVNNIKNVNEEWQESKKLEIIDPLSKFPGPYKILKVFSGDKGLDELREYLVERLSEKAESMGIKLDLSRKQPAVDDRRVYLDEKPERAAKQIRLKFGRNYCKDLFVCLQEEWLRTMK